MNDENSVELDSAAYAEAKRQGLVTVGDDPAPVREEVVVGGVGAATYIAVRRFDPRTGEPVTPAPQPVALADILREIDRLESLLEGARELAGDLESIMPARDVDAARKAVAQ